MLQRFFRRGPAIADISQLEDFLDSRSAFLAQKCIYEYSRARSGVLSSKLFKEATFRTAVASASWRNYPLCLQHLSVMVEYALRPYAGSEAGRMRFGLIASVRRICRRHPLPAGFAPVFWAEADTRVARRIAQAGLAAPHAVKDLPNETAAEFFAAMPIHPDLRSYDYELITNNVRVNLCRVHDDFLRDADLPRLSAALIASGHDSNSW